MLRKIKSLVGFFTVYHSKALHVQKVKNAFKSSGDMTAYRTLQQRVYQRKGKMAPVKQNYIFGLIHFYQTSGILFFRAL